MYFEEKNTPRSNLRKISSYILPPFHFFLVFTESFPLYSLPSFDLSLPLVDYVDDLLDACPIKALLETLCVVVRLNTTVQHHFHINAASWIGAKHLL